MPFSSTVVSAHRPTSLVLSFLVGKMAGNHRRRQGVEGEVLRPELAPSTCSGSGDCYGCIGVTPGRVCGTQVLRSPAPPTVTLSNRLCHVRSCLRIRTASASVSRALSLRGGQWGPSSLLPDRHERGWPDTAQRQPAACDVVEARGKATVGGPEPGPPAKPKQRGAGGSARRTMPSQGKDGPRAALLLLPYSGPTSLPDAAGAQSSSPDVEQLLRECSTERD